MALISCPECTSQISDKATSCPKCGNPMQLASDAEPQTHAVSDTAPPINPTNTAPQIQCSSCREAIPSNSVNCPKCGSLLYANKKKGGCFSVLVKIFAALVALFVLLLFYSTYQSTANDNAKPPTAEERAKMTPEEIKEAEDLAEKAKAKREERKQLAREKKIMAEERKAAQAERIAAEKAAEENEESEKKRKGFHCLPGWDGSNREVVKRVKAALNDPDSFDHDETLVSPVKDGRHAFKMRYRAKNGFGALVVGNAIGSYSNSDCDDVIIQQAQ